MDFIQRITQEYLGTSDQDSFALPFDALGIDSFLLMGLRAQLEVRLRQPIPDHVWKSFGSPQDIVDHYQDIYAQQSDLAAADVQQGALLEREIPINMPQMAFYGLSENWLFKELGDLHWTMICNALNVASYHLRDQANHRLYASFVRVRIEGAHTLKQFQENETLRIAGSLSRFGNSMFFSENVILAPRQMTISMMTTFSYRESGQNKSLVRGQPYVAGDAIREWPVMPMFGVEYSEMREGSKRAHTLAGEQFALNEQVLFETSYTINPFRDLNGVNLLYFASYPVISDICEAAFVHQQRAEHVHEHWAFESSPVARDVFYYRNCDFDDTIVFRLHTFEFVSETRVKIRSSLARASDGKLIADIFTVKEKQPAVPS